MKNPAPYIRKKLFALLNNAVTYESAAVPVYENEGQASIAAQILIKEYSDASKNNKHFFGANARQIIEVVTERNDSVTKHVDAIAEMVMDLIQPSPREGAIVSDDDFNVMIVGKPSMNLLTEDSGSGTKIVRRILTYNLLINHN
jgi:hypothetical protein